MVGLDISGRQRFDGCVRLLVVSVAYDNSSGQYTDKIEDGSITIPITVDDSFPSASLVSIVQLQGGVIFGQVFPPCIGGFGVLKIWPYGGALKIHPGKSVDSSSSSVNQRLSEQSGLSL